MMEIIRALEDRTVQLEAAKLFGSTLAEVERQSKARANEVVLQSGEEMKSQDSFRTGYVIAAAAVGAALLQAEWIHDHEWISMTFIFLLGYVGIVFKKYFRVQ